MYVRGYLQGSENGRVVTIVSVCQKRLNKLKNKWLLLHTGSEFQWYQTYERVYETSGSPLRFMLRRSSLIECVSVLPGSRCLQNVEFFCLRRYFQPCLLKNPKYTFYTIKSSLKLAYKMFLTRVGVWIKNSFNSWTFF
jgi:hypothetical protein